MTTELYWLTLTILMTSFFWVPYILDRIAVRGFIRAITGTRAETTDDQSEWAQRAIRAHANAIENLVLMGAAVLVAHALKISTPLTEAAVIVYFWVRLAHYFVYVIGIPVFRTPLFAAGWVCTLIVVLSILGWI